MTSNARWLATWIEVFCANVLRDNEYLGGRVGVGYAALIARTVADSCARLRQG